MPFSQVGLDSGTFFSPVEGSEFFLQKLFVPVACHIHQGIFLSSYLWKPGGVPGGKTYESVGSPLGCGPQEFLALVRPDSGSSKSSSVPTSSGSSGFSFR